MINLLKTLSFLAMCLAISLFASTIRADTNHTFTTELQEVRTGSIDGKVFLDVHISSSVGPSNCQGKVLRVDTVSVSQPGRQGIMESVALEAMLTSKPVIITVPTTWNDCVDGMPTMSFINLLRHAQ